MKTANDFKQAAREKNITFWGVHNCSMCGYECGYVIQGDYVSYDAGCNCTYGSGLEPRSWEDLAAAYNLNAGAPDVEERSKKHPAFAESVKEDREFWGFKD